MSAVMAARSARLLSCHCCQQTGGLTSRSMLASQALELKWSFTMRVQGSRSLAVMVLNLSQPRLMTKEGQGIHNERLGQVFLSDPALWWDNRFAKSPRSPDLRYRRLKEVLWIEAWSNPLRVNVELFPMIKGHLQFVDGSNLVVHHGAPGQEYTGMKWAKLLELDTSSMTTHHAEGLREGVNQNPLDACQDVRTLRKAGRLKELLQNFNQPEIPADSNIYVRLLQECIKVKDLETGRQVHAHMIQSGFRSNIFLSTTLVNMYAKCRSLLDARQVFDEMPERDVFTWTMMVAGYAKHGCGKEAFEIYEQMMREGVTPNKVTFICVLNACASLGALEKGKKVHADIVKAGITSYVNLENTLVDMYGKCGSMEDARQVFDNMVERDVVSWNALIAGYAQHEGGGEAFEIYEQMICKGVTPNRVTFICVLNACTRLGSLEKGKEIHANIMKAGFATNVTLENALVNMYAKCGSMKAALQVFHNMAEQDVVSWNALIAGYAHHGCGREAFEIYEQMQQEGVMPDKVTFVSVLNGCASLGSLEKGQQVHTDITKAGIVPDVILETALADMYAKCGSLKDARQVFDNTAKRNVISWNGMIAGYAQHGCGREALEMYDQMQREGVTPNRVTFTCVVNACASLGALERGKEIHADIKKAGIALDIVLETALTDMYSKCGSMKDACQVFDNMAQQDVVSWSVMITGYAQHGYGMEAIKIYEHMQREGLTPDRVTFICVLNACATLAALEKGKDVHADIIKAGIAPDIIVEGALLKMYAKCGNMKDAHQVFDNMAERDVVAWSVMIAGYAQHGCGREALQIYEQMQWAGVTPDRVLFICVLNVCASLVALEKGKEVHAEIMKAGIVPDLILETALVEMYAKCGNIKDARQLFDNMAQRDVVSWSAMIAGYAQHGYGREAFDIYEQMQCEGVTPDRVTFICILNACAGLAALEKGEEVHADIIKNGIVPDVILDTALADMYVKCGSMKDARQVFCNMAERNVVAWNAMIAGCAQHGCGREALRLFEEMQQEGLKPNGITFVSLLSACSHVGLVEEGCQYFDTMGRDHSLTPTLEHFCCVVDLLGRAGRLDEAENFIHNMPIKPDARVWRALLGACRIHGDVEVAERAAKGVVKSDPQHTAAYVLLSNIYAAAGRWDDKAKVRKQMQVRGVTKEPGHSCIEVDKEVHTFVVEDKLQSMLN